MKAINDKKKRALNSGTSRSQTFLRFGSLEIFKTEDHITGRAGPSAGLALAQVYPQS